MATIDGVCQEMTSLVDQTLAMVDRKLARDDLTPAVRWQLEQYRVYVEGTRAETAQLLATARAADDLSVRDPDQRASCLHLLKRIRQALGDVPDLEST